MGPDPMQWGFIAGCLVICQGVMKEVHLASERMRRHLVGQT